MERRDTNPVDRVDRTDDIARRLNRSSPGGSAARQHWSTRMMAVSERRERAAEILAEGLVKLLKSKATEADREHPPRKRSGDGEVPRLKLVHSHPEEDA